MTDIERTISDGIEANDDEQRDFCLHAHAHFRAQNIDHALRSLAVHFVRISEGGDSGFLLSGTLEIGPVDAVHSRKPGVIN